MPKIPTDDQIIFTEQACSIIGEDSVDVDEVYVDKYGV